MMNDWPYGHWITQIAQRIPNSNPHQAPGFSTTSYFTAEDEASANQILGELGSKYVIIDLDMATVTDNANMMREFPNIATWAGKDLSQFCRGYFEQKDGKFNPVVLYYPEYYQCISTQLFNFHGDKITPSNSSMVISYSTNESGQRIIQTSQTFQTYEEAKSYLDSQKSPNYKLVGTSPFISQYRWKN
jgi:asparagine N-glycosylation enzyme membrane subunit Stt3